LYRKNHQRALDAMQLNLEAESRNKMDAMRVKKKLEQDINELEVTLDAVNKARAETERNFKKYQQQIRDLQQVRLVIIATSYRPGSSGTICPPADGSSTRGGSTSRPRTSPLSARLWWPASRGQLACL